MIEPVTEADIQLHAEQILKGPEACTPEVRKLFHQYVFQAIHEPMSLSKASRLLHEHELTKKEAQRAKRKARRAYHGNHNE